MLIGLDMNDAPWDLDNLNLDNLNSLLIRTKSYFPWFSPHFLIIFT